MQPSNIQRYFGGFVSTFPMKGAAMALASSSVLTSPGVLLLDLAFFRGLAGTVWMMKEPRAMLGGSLLMMSVVTVSCSSTDSSTSTSAAAAMGVTTIDFPN